MDRLPVIRRGLRRPDAATYVGMSPSKFDEMVKDRRMPPPIRVDGCVIWDVRQLDLAFDALSDDVEEEDEWAGV